MKKWGIRLISVCFWLGAVATCFDIITKENPPRGFLGISFSLFSGSSPESMTSQLDIMALIGLCVYVYIAYNLLKSNEQGRIWALAILWISVLRFVFSFIYTVIKSPMPWTSISMVANYPGHSYILNAPGIFLVSTGVVLLLYALPIYFLMRKDVKMDFQARETPELKPATE